MQLLTLVIIALPVASLARSSQHLNRQHGPRRNNVARDTNYKLQTKHQGQNFFDNWNFYTESDPNGGNVQFESKENAADLAFVQDGVAVIKVDNKSTVPAGGKRRSVRITSKETYNGGLFIADLPKFANGPSVGPAFWTAGPESSDGQIDVVKCANNENYNQFTLHTSGECKLDPNVTAKYKNEDGSQPKPFLGGPVGLDCKNGDSGSDAGCAIKGPSGSVGSSFNKAGGGVVAMLWDQGEVTYWTFDRQSIPQDIQDGSPDPATWGVPVVYMSGQSCDISNSFRNHNIIFDISICGDRAGDAYKNDGFSGSCTDAVATATNYDDAAIHINYLSIYQQA